ncbi:MAG: 1-acyl-sn-glycerol-3-phosphate acyltransferase [Clostridia bacterium]|nr:1-acyl-sn-glycerol-3-phosphate acyltransferase [Clostridia bacterium]
MKIRQIKMPYEKVKELPRPKHFDPVRPNMFFRLLMRGLSIPDMLSSKCTYTKTNMEKAGDGPWLILMNHSSFVDFEIAQTMLFPKPACVVATTDAFVSKAWLMKQIGCIPTQKFVNDITLLKDMNYALNVKKTSVLMYPEAGYSFDGTATVLPRGFARLLKRLDVPVVSIHTEGAFLREPLYNCLQKRKVKVSADMSCIISKEDLKTKSVEELEEIIEKAFTFDSFAWQYENKVEINEPFRAYGLNRILYKCASCHEEGFMEGKGTTIKCNKCGKEYELDKYGKLVALDGDSVFTHIPDWYNWERECVRNDILEGKYLLDIDVEIGVMVDYKGLYMIGSGHLTHDRSGFKLVSDDGQLEYTQKPMTAHTLNSDYYWYEIGDIISIGNRDTLFYCFPKGNVDVVAKTRLAAEEMYNLVRPKAIATRKG